MVKPSCPDSQKAVWNEDEDEKTSAKQPGSGNWTTFSKRSGQRRNGKNSRERSSGSQKTDSKHKSFTPQEEDLVIQLHAAIGSRWFIIAQQIPGKTDNDVKILWNSKLRKKLSAMGIDPVTHKPFSQILADYGNIGAFPKARTRFTSLSRDLKNAIVFRNEQPRPDKNEHRHNHNYNHHNQQLYSQLQAVNLVTTEAYIKAENTPECPASEAATDQSYSTDQMSSFSWSDFFVEDAFVATEVEAEVQGGEAEMGGGKSRVEERMNGGFEVGNNSFEASSSSNSSSFVDAMIGSQDQIMFSHLSCSYEDPFYY